MPPPSQPSQLVGQSSCAPGDRRCLRLSLLKPSGICCIARVKACGRKGKRRLRFSRASWSTAQKGPHDSVASVPTELAHRSHCFVPYSSRILIICPQRSDMPARIVTIPTQLRMPAISGLAELEHRIAPSPFLQQLFLSPGRSLVRRRRGVGRRVGGGGGVLGWNQRRWRLGEEPAAAASCEESGDQILEPPLESSVMQNLILKTFFPSEGMMIKCLILPKIFCFLLQFQRQQNHITAHTSSETKQLTSKLTPKLIINPGQHMIPRSSSVTKLSPLLSSKLSSPS